jgi:hypothetical protein
VLGRKSISSKSIETGSTAARESQRAAAETA